MNHPGSYNHFAEKCFMVETSRYRDMYLRPYESNFDAQTESLLDHYTDGGRNVTAAAVSRVANVMLKPSAMPEMNAMIANGFGEKRYSIMLLAQSKNRAASNLTTVITGYTDYLGAINDTRGRYLDPDMNIYFNGLYVYRTEDRPTSRGVATIGTMSRGTQIVHQSGQDVNDPYGNYNNPLYLARPEDISGYLSFDSDETMRQFRSVGARDRRHTLQSSPKASKRSNLTRSSYVSDILHGYKATMLEVDAVDDVDVWDTTRTRNREISLNDNPLMSTIALESNYLTTGCITYGELCDIISNLDDVVDVADTHSTHDIQYTANWDSATAETQAAAIVQQCASAIMSDCLLMNVHVVAHNDTIDGQIWIDCPHFESFNSNMDMTNHVQRFINRFMDEVLMDISMGNQIPFAIDAKIELLYEAEIMVNIDNGGDALYIAPAFCDALYSPTLTQNESVIESIAEDVESMTNSLVELTPQQYLHEPRTSTKVQNAGRFGSHSNERRTAGGVIIPSSV